MRTATPRLRKSGRASEYAFRSAFVTDKVLKAKAKQGTGGQKQRFRILTAFRAMRKNMRENAPPRGAR
jgi:hypothetical protein